MAPVVACMLGVFVIASYLSVWSDVEYILTSVCIIEGCPRYMLEYVDILGHRGST